MKQQTSGYIYLIGEINHPHFYKIGFTRSENINKRLQKLQTGNSNELYLKSKFYSNNVTKLEKMLHFHYKENHTINEWFEINEEEVENFNAICQKYQNIIDSLKDNPFF